MLETKEYHDYTTKIVEKLQNDHDIHLTEDQVNTTLKYFLGTVQKSTRSGIDLRLTKFIKFVTNKVLFIRSQGIRIKTNSHPKVRKNRFSKTYKWKEHLNINTHTCQWLFTVRYRRDIP